MASRKGGNVNLACTFRSNYFDQIASGFKHRKSGSSKYYCGLKLKITLKQHKLDDVVEGDTSGQYIMEGTDGEVEYINKGTVGTDSDYFPISSPIRARVRSIKKTPLTVPSVPLDDNVPPQIDQDEHHANRLQMTTSEARVIGQVHAYATEDGGHPVLFHKILEITGLSEKLLQDIIRTSREAGRLVKAQSEPEPGFLVTLSGLKAIMEFEKGVAG